MSGNNEHDAPPLAEYHPRPSGHFVFDQVAWDLVKATLPTGENSLIAGQVGASAVVASTSTSALGTAEVRRIVKIWRLR